MPHWLRCPTGSGAELGGGLASSCPGLVLIEKLTREFVNGLSTDSSPKLKFWELVGGSDTCHRVINYI